MQAKMATASGRATYGQRKHLVEAVFGNLKFNPGFARFGLRSLAKVRDQSMPMCIVHNLKKLATYGSLSPAAQTAALKAVQTAFSWLLRLYQRLQEALKVDFYHSNTNCQTAA
jgi:hypothetical protein